MGRLLAIDYGRRRCGIAVTDSLRIVGNSLATVPTSSLEIFLADYMAREQVDEIIVGLPRNMNGQPSESMRYIRPALDRLRRRFPQTPFVMFDERFTSVLAHRSMLESGMKKMQRRDKGAVDTMAAAIILNDYLQSKSYQQ